MDHCDVCHKEAWTDAVASSLDAWSYAICRECLIHDAEPLGALLDLLKCGCVEQDLENYITYQNGGYLRFGDRDRTPKP